MCLYAAAKLRLADHVAAGKTGAGELAQATGMQPGPLSRLLRALASVGVFAEGEGGRFQLTPLAQTLRDAPGSQRGLAIMHGEEHYRAWGEVLHSLRTGGSAFEHVFGQPVFDFLASHPEQARVFDDAMVGVHGVETQAMLDAYDFSTFGTLVDVGGGNGSLLSAVLKQTPGLRGILYDLPHVVERARTGIEAAGLAGRCQTIGGSFFESVPPGGDGYLLRHIIHDWDDEKSLVILRHVRKVIPPAGKLVVVEGVVPPGNDPSFIKLLDMNMLVLPGGMERTEAEYRALYSAAGFALRRVVPTRCEVSVIEGTPV
jgi:hypothetical protein